MAARKTVFNDKQRILRLYSALISHRALSIEEIEDMFFKFVIFYMICKLGNRFNLKLSTIATRASIN